MTKEYRLLPTSTIEMANCIKTITDDYKATELTDRQFTEIANKLVSDNKRFFWDTPGNINVTIKRKCGKKRLALLCTVLYDVQISIEDL